MTNYKQALDYATSKHAGQIRRFSGEPYIRHPERVVEILRSYGVTDDDTLQAAIMHDCLEDTDATVEEMRTILGDNMKVIRGVLYLTDPCLSIIVEGKQKLKSLTDTVFVWQERQATFNQLNLQITLTTFLVWFNMQSLRRR